MASDGLTLYHVVPSRSCRVLWLINELELSVKVVEKNFLKDPNVLETDEFRAVNPAAKLPALVEGAATVYESTACLLWLLEQHGNGKLEPPKSDAAARADFLQWTIVAETGLTAGLADLFWHTIQFPEEKRKPQVAERGKDFALKQFDVLEKTLADGREFLVNKEFSVADISVGYACNFLKMLQLDDEARFPNVRKYTERVTSRPAFQKAFGS
jgi:glutathione S-transferase